MIVFQILATAFGLGVLGIFFFGLALGIGRAFVLRLADDVEKLWDRSPPDDPPPDTRKALSAGLRAFNPLGPGRSHDPGPPFRGGRRPA